ncbi:ABC transporter ATP-binding protein [Wenxinia saemankumensis]|uniref:Putative spermidine/putrescine transport system ATP-binding protein n=1 Tax=Wenxinia saemankumensis TaxID=1447782 RepID=A0A1M6DRE3_9RHOB|nr:ABC transporter ATP-binding protein [Wenxinia saemankumensis]SHI75826.1 putative spermidine/putrescine transport system ATP-binding protein [Wenxinia saemankumensis]
MTGLRLEGLTARYGDHAAVAGLDLAVAPGERLALLGPSGCGKTTTLRMIAGLLAPAAGRVLMDGADVTRHPPERRQAVLVFQSGMLFPSMSVEQNVAFGLRMRGVPRAARRDRARAMLARVRLDGLADRRPADLSGGQAQRVALARALVLEPRLLLLDEPLSSLDAGLRDEMRELVLALQRESGVTTIMVTHDQAEAVAMADRIALMLDGRLRQVGPPEALWHRPADAQVARFFGGVNFWPGRGDGTRFDCALGPVPCAAEGPGLLTIRPEAVRLDAAGPGALPARETGRRFLGAVTRLRLVVGADGGEVIADSPAPPETITQVTLPRAALHLLPPP